MAAVFPLDTTQPWTFNGVTYEYDALEDRWSVVSTVATDQVVENLGDLERNLEVTNEIIDQEIDNRTVLLNAAASKNNEQDAALIELSGRIDQIGESVGILEFKGSYKYVLEKSEASCDAALAACLIAGNNEPVANSECLRLHGECMSLVGHALEQGTFTSIGTVDQSDTEELCISRIDLDGNTFDWENLIEPGDYIELVETTASDSVLYEVIDDPTKVDTDELIRVKYIKESGLGDGNFNLQEVSEIRVLKAKLGLDIVEADKRYVQRPYTVQFSNTAPTEGQAVDKSLQNGELWYDTQNLELFVWNNNAWVSSAKPPSQDVVVAEVISDVDRLMEESAGHAAAINSLVSDLAAENNIYYSDDAPTGDFTGTLRNGDIWIDSDDLTIKFYSGGAWINPDRQVGGDYLEKSGGYMTGDIDMMGGPEPGANIYMHNNAFIRFGWGSTPATLYGGYVFMRDENIFEIGAYNDKLLRFKGSSEFLSAPQVPEPTDDAHASTKKYVDDRIAELEARITALGG